MKKPEIVPRDLPREFRADEMFFSTTDARGVITAGNEVFVRISGYAHEQLIGRAHNIIRHPDMPRAAFRLVWGYLKQSRRVVALVKNLAKDGCYYWVVALLVPAGDGYLSIRFKPTTAALDSVSEIYAAMLEEEERQLAAGATEEVAMDASTAVLQTAMKARGLADYDAFMRVLLCDELKSRDAVLAQMQCAVIRPPAEQHEAKGGDQARAVRLRGIYRRGATAYQQLNGLFVRLDEFVTLQQSLRDKGAFVENLTRELRLAAMNASLASTRIGNSALSLGVVSDYMGNASAQVAGSVSLLSEGIRGVSRHLRSVIFNLATSRLEIEMIMTFLHELIAHAESAAATTENAKAISILQHAFRHSLDRACLALGELEGGTRQLNPTARRLARHMLDLQVAQLSGVVETTRLEERGDFNAVFGHMRELIGNTRGQLAGLDAALAQLDEFAIQTPAKARGIAATANEMESEVTAFAAA